MSQPIKVNTASLMNFLKLCEQAEKAGLEFTKTKKGEFNLSIHTNELTVHIKKYDVTSQNGYGTGHTMMTVWTKYEAEQVRGIADLAIADSNSKRFTEITVSPHESVNKEDLQYFIKTHTKKKI